MLIGERLRLLRKEKGISKRELVSNLPLNYSTYANYESGFREPNSEVLQILARHYGVSIDFIIGITDNRKKADEIAVLNESEHSHIMDYRNLDEHGRKLVDSVLQIEAERMSFPNEKPMTEHKQVMNKQWVSLQIYQQRASAGLGNYLSDDSDTDFEMLRFQATPVSLKADFGVRIRGDSMEPKICDGDIVFVKALPQIEADCIGVFTYEGEAYCKRLRIDHKKGTIHLESLNKSYAPKHIQQPDYLRTVGLVIGVADQGKE